MSLVPRQDFAAWWSNQHQFASYGEPANRLYLWFLLLLLLCGAPLAAGVLLSPDGPRTLLGRTTTGLALGLVAWGITWVVTGRSFGDLHSLILFGSLDVFTFISFTQYHSPTLQLLGVFVYCPLAFLIGFRHGARVLAAHCVFAATAIGYLLVVYMASGQSCTTGLVIGLALLIATVSMPISCHVFLDMFLRGTLDSRVDHLTRVLNRRGFIDRWATMTAGYAIGDPVALIGVDLDNFKRVNDLHGHEAGDLTLRRTADILTSAAHGAVGGHDALIARTGGDEFVVALALAENNRDPQHFANVVANRICTAIRAGTPHQTTASIGVAIYTTPPPKHGAETGALAPLHSADEGIYHAKSAGGDRVAPVPTRN